MAEKEELLQEFREVRARYRELLNRLIEIGEPIAAVSALTCDTGMIECGTGEAAT